MIEFLIYRWCRYFEECYNIIRCWKDDHIFVRFMLDVSWRVLVKRSLEERCCKFICASVVSVFVLAACHVVYACHVWRRACAMQCRHCGRCFPWCSNRYSFIGNVTRKRPASSVCQLAFPSWISHTAKQNQLCFRRIRSSRMPHGNDQLQTLFN